MTGDKSSYAKSKDLDGRFVHCISSFGPGSYLFSFSRLCHSSSTGLKNFWNNSYRSIEQNLSYLIFAILS